MSLIDLKQKADIPPDMAHILDGCTAAMSGDVLVVKVPGKKPRGRIARLQASGIGRVLARAAGVTETVFE